jgi:hypothetical protein
MRECTGCSQPFAPSRRDQMSCGKNCRERASYRRRTGGLNVAPEMIGLVESVTTEGDEGGSRIVLADGQELTKDRDDRALPGAPGPGDLLWFGAQPERWFLSAGFGATFQKSLGCYVLSADRAFSEPDSVVLAFSRWPGVGIRLPKAPGFDDSRLVTKNSEGRLEYSALASVAFCSDAQGRLSGI